MSINTFEHSNSSGRIPYSPSRQQLLCRSKRWFICLLFIFTAVLALTACSRADEDGNDSKPASRETVTISYGLWGSEEREEYTLAQIAAFEEDYPYITVELNYASWAVLKDEIDDIMAEGRQSDVMQINYDWLARYSQGGDGFYDLNELSDYIQLDAFSDNSIMYGQVDGRQYAVPTAFNTSVPVYNESMYDQYGLAVPESVDELFEAAAVMKDDGIYQLGMEDKQILLFLAGCYVDRFGEDLIDDEGNFSISTTGILWLAEFYKECMNECVIYPRAGYSDSLIASNRVSGVICWLNSIENYKELMSNAGDTPVVGRFLWTDTNKTLGNYVKPSTMLAISAHTEHPEEAALLLNYLCNDETAVNLQGEEKGVPDSRYAQQYLMKSGSLNNDTFYTTLRLNFYMEYMQAMPQKLEDADLIGQVLSALDAYVYDSQSLEETIAVLRKVK